ncbi:hypothetical protein GH5_07398 [Leishmania sp. Ghana 2012 LV757]|uniref:hypothetical protein n=1 Tax=Leishmania sp. Ghana 2012 LV757 TaxID=2803181 RepID=UPI001B3DA999|nr:hypothetical protein GH5_07398 [Leishmania sp. Ghana 2012 LV757]
MANKALLAGALLALVLCLAATAVSAQRSLECQMVWLGPSPNNSLLDCLKDKDRIRSQWPYYVYPSFAALIFIFTIVGLPIVFCCHCCSCCEACVRPKATVDLRAARCYLWMWIVISVLVACGVCVLLIFGAVLLGQTAAKILNDAENRTISYFNGTRTNITSLLTNYNTDPPTPPPVDLSAFDTVITEITRNVDTIRDNYLKYFRTAEIVACCVGGVGVFLMLCMLIFAFCRCTGCCPVAWSCLYFVLALVYALLAVLFTVSIYVLFAGCGEVNLQYKREPGVFQWYLVPWCEQKFSFQSLRADVQAQEQEISQRACEELLKFCDNNPQYPGSNMEHIFMCGNGITDKSQCETLDDVVNVILTTYVKPVLTNTLCPNQEGMEKLEKCTVADCASRCVNYEFPDLRPKEFAMEIMSATYYAANASTALSYVWPLLECGFVIDKVASTIEMPRYSSGFTTPSDAVHSCSALRTSSVMLGTGFFVGSLMFILGIYITHRGAWIWGCGRAQVDAVKKAPVMKRGSNTVSTPA